MIREKELDNKEQEIYKKNATNKNMKKRILTLITGTLLATAATAQTKIKDGTITGTSSLPNTNAILELESTNKGLLYPRVALTDTALAAPLSAHVAGMMVYDTATNVATGITPGVYYNDGTKWIKSNTAYQEPFQVESTTTKATTNTQNIYQNGNLGLGDFSTSNPIAKLDVHGSVRAGGESFTYLGIPFPATPHLGTVGPSSAAFGYGNIASGIASFATGMGSQATGVNSTAMGSEAVAAGPQAFALGNAVTASSQIETVFGINNAIKTGSATNLVATDALFQVGDGYQTGPTIPNNALTILKNGNTGIGITGTEATAKPTERLDIGSGNTFFGAGLGGVRIRAINTAAYTGLATDNIVVASTTGVLKTIAPSALTTEPFQVESTTTKASTNTQNIYQNGNLGLGNFATANPIAKLDVRGAVRGGTPNTNVVAVVGTNSIAVGNKVQATAPGATALGNGGIASGSGSVALGGSGSDITGFTPAAIPTASGTSAFAMGDYSVASGTNSTAIGLGAVASGSVSFAAGQGSVASGSKSRAFGQTANAVGDVSTAMGNVVTASSMFETVIGTRNAITTGSASAIVATDALLQVGNGVSGLSNALTILKNGNTGIAITGTGATAKPTSTLQVAGSLSLALRVVSGASTLTDKDHTIIYTGSTGTTMTLPDPATCNGRIYRIVQYIGDYNGNSGIDITFSRGVYCMDVLTTTVITTTSLWKAHQEFVAGGDTGGSNSLTIQSDGSDWYAVGL